MSRVSKKLGSNKLVGVTHQRVTGLGKIVSWILGSVPVCWEPWLNSSRGCQSARTKLSWKFSNQLCNVVELQQSKKCKQMRTMEVCMLFQQPIFKHTMKTHSREKPNELRCSGKAEGFQEAWLPENWGLPARQSGKLLRLRGWPVFLQNQHESSWGWEQGGRFLFGWDYLG